MTEEAPSLQPEPLETAAIQERHRARNKPIMSAGTGL
jgi:two-component system, cell cycle sensor histidine kinase PleC